MHACTLKKLYVNVVANSGNGNAIFTVRKNGADTALTLTVGAEQTGVFSVTADVSVSNGDLLALELDQSGVSSGTISAFTHSVYAV